MLFLCHEIQKHPQCRRMFSRHAVTGRAQAECNHPPMRPGASCPRKFSPTFSPKRAKNTLDNRIPLQKPQSWVGCCRVSPHLCPSCMYVSCLTRGGRIMGLGGTCLGTQVWDLSPWVPPRPGRGRARESGTGVETNCRSCMCVICKWHC